MLDPFFGTDFTLSREVSLTRCKKSHKPTLCRESSSLNHNSVFFWQSLYVNIQYVCTECYTGTATVHMFHTVCKHPQTSAHLHASACTRRHETQQWSAYVEMTQHLLAFHCHWCPCCSPWALPSAQPDIMDINKESG